MFKFASFAAAASLLAASAVAAPIQWDIGSGGNGHWYDFSTTASSLTTLKSSVDTGGFTHGGLVGYLVTITSVEELAFVASQRPYSNNSLWIGASDAASEGEWRWLGGPEAGQAVDFAGVGRTSPGVQADGWNDGNDFLMMGGASSNLWRSASAGSSAYYAIEYSAASEVVPTPLPAAAPLLAAGLGLIGWMSRRRVRA